MTRCGNCGIADIEFILRIDADETYTQCPECGATDCEEEVNDLDWAEEMADDEIDNLLDYRKGE
jgi:hypothetical protein